MGLIERLLRNSKKTGEDLVRFEAEKLGLGRNPSLTDIDIMAGNASRIGAVTGLNSSEQITAIVYGANSSRGLRNEKVNGFKK